MSHIDMPPPKKHHSLQIERLPMGGYLIVTPGGQIMPTAFLAACSTMAEVLDFIRHNMEPSATTEKPNDDLPY